MTVIRVHRHAVSAEPPLEFRAPNVGEWLLEHYGPAPGFGVYVFAGEPSRQTDVTGDVQALARSDAPLYVVLETPGDPTTILINLAISTALSLVSSVIFAKDPKPLDNRTQESPNNALQQRENQVRAMQRVEDIFGTVRSIPSLIMLTYRKYIQHMEVEYSLMCIGRGYYDVDDIRDGDTELSGITGASAAVYPPFTSPNSGTPQLTIGDDIIDPVLSVTRSSSVDDLILKPINQSQFQPDMRFMFRGPGTGTDGGLPTTTGDLIFQPEDAREPNVAAVAQNGQALTITMASMVQTREIAGGAVVTVSAAAHTYAVSVIGFFLGVVDGSTVTVGGAFADAHNTGDKLVLSHTGETLTVDPGLGLVDDATGAATFALAINYSGTRTIDTVENGYATLTGASAFYPGVETIIATLTVDNGLSDWTDWFTLPAVDRTQVFTNVLARGGMYKDDGAKQATSVSYEVQIEQLDAALTPTGTVETVTGSISGATSAQRAETLERVTAWTGPARVRARRTTPFDYDFAGFVQDEITWVDLYAVAPVTKPHFGNKTIIHTVTRATPGAAALQRRQLNCLASRKLPTFDGATFSGAFDSSGLLVAGTISATSRIVDIIAAVTLDPQIGGRPIDDVDMAQIWGVQQDLDDWNTECGQFNYTFDSDSVSYEETVKAIAQAAFCTAYRQNGQIRLALDRPQPAPVATFMHRNKAPREETITRRFASDSEYDGVELVYVDPDTEAQETIRLPLDGSFTKLKKVEVTGVRSYEQAWFQANRQMQRLMYERLALEVKYTVDARALLPNARIENVDNTQFKSFDGEVIAQSGLDLTLSKNVEFLPATPHSIILRRRDGTIESIAVTAGSATNHVLLAAPPSEPIVTVPDPDDGMRTSFSFAADSARGAMAWLVQQMDPPDESGYVRVRAVNYADAYYDADSLPIPAKAGVIN